MTSVAAALIDKNKQDLKSVENINAAEAKTYDLGIKKADTEIKLQQAQQKLADKKVANFLDAKNKQLTHDSKFAQTKIKTLSSQTKIAQQTIDKLTAENAAKAEAITQANAQQKLQAELKFLQDSSRSYQTRIDELKKNSKRTPAEEVILKGFNTLNNRAQRRIAALQKAQTPLLDIQKVLTEAPKAIETIKANRSIIEGLSQEIKVFAQEITQQQALQAAAEKASQQIQLFEKTGDQVVKAVSNIGNKFKIPQLSVATETKTLPKSFSSVLTEAQKIKSMGGAKVKIPTGIQKPTGTISQSVARGANAFMRVVRILPK